MTDERNMSDIRLRQFVEQSPFAIAMFDREMRYIFASQKWFSDFRLKIEEVQGKSHYELFPEIPEHWKEIHRRCLAGATLKNDEEAFHRLDGSTDWIRWEVRPWYENPETIGGIIIFSEDISLRKNAEEALKATNRLLEENQSGYKDFYVMAESMPQIVWVTRADGSNIYFNKQWVDYTGQTLEESYGDGWNKPFHPEDRERAWIAWQNATKNGEKYTLECRIRRADGEYKWWLVRGLPMLKANKTISNWIGTCTDIDEMKHLEVVLNESNSKLEKSEAQYHEAELNLNLALGSAKMGTWWMDVKTMHTQISPSLAALYGVTETEGQNPDLIAKLIHPDDRVSLQLKLTEALQSLKPTYHEFRIIRSDGEVRWHYSRSAFTFDKDGRPLCLYGIQGDRTENKIQSDALRDSEEKYRNLVADAQDGILIVSEQGQIIFGNHQLEVMFGYSFNELINQPIELLVPEHLRTAHVIQRNEYLVNPTKRPMGRMGVELNGRRKDGSEFPVDIGLSPSLTSKGKIVTAIIRDITVRKKKEVQVQFLATASRVLAESFDDASAMSKIAQLTIHQIADGCTVRLIGEDAKLTVAASIHRDPKKQLIMEKFAKIYDSRGVLSQELDEAIKTQTVQICNDFNKIRFANLGLESSESQDLEKLGEFNSAVIPLLVNGVVIGVFSIMSDKSERRYEESDIEFLESIGNQIALSIENVHLYNKAQNAIKLREEILAIVSHDLRNPLSTIQMTGQILPKIIDDKAKVLSFSEKILRSTDQMKRMIEDLMDFAKIQEGKLSIEKNVEDPKAALEMVIEMMNAQANEKGLELFIEVSPKLPAIQYDKQRIAQALLNLVGNAIKFTEIGGQVYLAATEVNGGVKFSVTDTGPGICEEDLPKIFDRYWQAKKSKSASAGLGLSITKGIIEAHGSQIRVESQIGKGSTFYFILPVSG